MGIDSSEDAVRRARDERPDGRFALGTLADNAVEADITLCLDQLTLPMDAPEYQDLVALLWKSSRKALIVRGYEDPRGYPRSRRPVPRAPFDNLAQGRTRRGNLSAEG